jgi:predicted transposase YbfD/YdcC
MRQLHTRRRICSRSMKSRREPCWRERAVATKENEISAAPALVRPELLRGRICSADAMHTQKNWCREVTRAGGDYLLLAKNNQATLREDLALFLDDTEADRRCWQTASTCNKGHGRLEKRTLIATTELNAFLSGSPARGSSPLTCQALTFEKPCRLIFTFSLHTVLCYTVL